MSIVPPVLTAEEWETAPRELVDYDDALYQLCSPGMRAEDLPRIIARVNAMLPGDDRRKMTRDWVLTLRFMARYFEVIALQRHDDESRATELSTRAKRANEMADAIESYLPRSNTP